MVTSFILTDMDVNHKQIPKMNGLTPLGPKEALEDYAKMIFLMFSFLFWALLAAYISNRHDT